MHFFVNEEFSIVIEISLKCVPKRPVDNNSALVYIMAWRRIGDKPLSEPMLTWFTDAYMRRWRQMKQLASADDGIKSTSVTACSNLYFAFLWVPIKTFISNNLRIHAGKLNHVSYMGAGVWTIPLRNWCISQTCIRYCPVYGAFDLGLAVSVPLPIVTGIFVLLWFQSRLT